MSKRGADFRRYKNGSQHKQQPDKTEGQPTSRAHAEEDTPHDRGMKNVCKSVNPSMSARRLPFRAMVFYGLTIALIALSFGWQMLHGRLPCTIEGQRAAG
jgi:hypothetical protein